MKERISRKRAEMKEKQEMKKSAAQQDQALQAYTLNNGGAGDLEQGHKVYGSETPYSVPSTYTPVSYQQQQPYDPANVYQPPAQYYHHQHTGSNGGEAQSYFNQQPQYGNVNVPYGQGGLGYTTTGARNDAGAGPYAHNA
jgi:hypothetical protein